MTELDSKQEVTDMGGLFVCLYPYPCQWPSKNESEIVCVIIPKVNIFSEALMSEF